MISAAILAVAGAIMIPAWGEEILLYTQQPYSISANRTLVAEDVDPHSGVVWLKLYCKNEALESALLGVGDHFGYDNLNLTIIKIYAGGERDLVRLELDNGSAVDVTPLNVSRRPVNASINIPLIKEKIMSSGREMLFEDRMDLLWRLDHKDILHHPQLLDVLCVFFSYPQPHLAPIR